MNKVQIASLLLTRKCNLKCDYCAISNIERLPLLPQDYPDTTYYHRNEKNTKWWINVINKLHKHNSNIFLLLYGGETLLRNDLPKIINWMHTKEINYTIISNCHPDLERQREKLFETVGVIRGFTASIDPGYYLDLIDKSDDEKKKSQYGYHVLTDLIKKGMVKDPVAEMVISSQNLDLVEESIKRLTAEGICTDITTLDISKNNYYDFSTVTDPRNLVHPSEKVKNLFERLKNSDYNIHMKDTLLDKIFDILPAELKCEQGPGNIKHLTIDSDGAIRACLRIRGRFSPIYNGEDLFTEKHIDIESAIGGDYELLCKGCAWTCPCISSGTSEQIINHK